MIPSTDELRAGLGFLARRFGVPEPTPSGVARARAEAQALARGIEWDEPAALFFSLARRPRALGELWPRAPAVIANAHARRLGLPAAADDGLRRLRMGIAQNRTTYPDVREWFREAQGRES